MTLIKKKVKQSLYRPGQVTRVPGGWDSLILRQSPQEGDKIVSPTYRSYLLLTKYSWFSLLVRRWVDPWAIGRQEVSCQWKIPMTPSGIEPATFRLRVQCLNHLCYSGNRTLLYDVKKFCTIFYLFRPTCIKFDTSNTRYWVTANFLKPTRWRPYFT